MAQTQALARNIAAQLKDYATSLHDQGIALQDEIANAVTATEEISRERDQLIHAFVASTLTSLESTDLAQIETIAARIPEIGSASLSFIAQNLDRKRQAALSQAEKVVGEPLTVEDFQTHLEKLQSELVDIDYNSIRYLPIQRTWDVIRWQKTPEYELVYLEKLALENGEPAISPDNRAYYEPEDLIDAAYRYTTGSSTYRAIRDAMEKYGHGQNGKDVFADMHKFRQTDKETTESEKEASRQCQEAHSKLMDIEPRLLKLKEQKANILTDEEILDIVKERAKGFFVHPSFCKEMSEHYAEDFPSKVFLLNLKLAAMAKIIHTAQAQHASLKAELTQVASEHSKLSRAPKTAVVKIDPQKLSEYHTKKLDHYKSQTTTTHDSWTKNMDFDDIASPAVELTADVVEAYLRHRIFLGTSISSDTASAATESVIAASNEIAIPETDFDFTPAIPSNLASDAASALENTASAAEAFGAEASGSTVDVDGGSIFDFLSDLKMPDISLPDIDLSGIDFPDIDIF